MLNFELIGSFFTNNYQWLVGLLIGGGIERILYRPIKFKIDEKKVIKVLDGINGKDKKFEWLPTRSISNDSNLTKERVYLICSKSKKIKESKGGKEGLWSLRENSEDEEMSGWDELTVIDQ